MSRWKSGTVGWVALCAYVVGWDYVVALRGHGETLSSAFGRATQHPLYRWPVTVAWLVTTLHIFGFLTPSHDPFVRVSNYISKRAH